MKQNESFRRTFEEAIKAVQRETVAPARALGLPVRGTAKAASKELDMILERYGDELPDEWRDYMPAGVGERAECLYAIEQIYFKPTREGRDNAEWIYEFAEAQERLRRAFPKALRQRLAQIEDASAKAA
ncbi:MAG TPA: hypothetical protein VMV27_07805 [Candidatus Binataceae bacterium]|nr:hypothetical protein [Candidatus Binataceae bacterium]